MDDVTLGYDGKPIVSGVNLTIHAGELVVIVGSSGCGKSTLLKGAIGLLAPFKGTVRLFGKDLSVQGEEELSLLRTKIGMLFQGGALINSLTVAENVALPLSQFTRLPESVVDTLVRMKLGQVGLEEALSKTPPELSGGMRKRAALARALALDPVLLFCDEPSAGLDPVTAAGLDQLLMDLRLALNMTLVVVTHELGSIHKIADRVVMVADGKIVFDGDLSQAIASESQVVSDFFERRPTRTESLGVSMFERFTRFAGR